MKITITGLLLAITGCTPNTYKETTYYCQAPGGLMRIEATEDRTVETECGRAECRVVVREDGKAYSFPSTACYLEYTK